MKKNKTIISLLLLAAAIISVFSACAEKTDAPDTTETADVTTAPEAPSGFVVCDAASGKDSIFIVRSMNDNPIVTAVSVELNKAMKSKCPDGWKNTISDDFVKGYGKNDIIDNDTVEILVGVTNRKQSVDVIDSLSENEWVVKIVDSKLIIAGENDVATRTAVREFIAAYLEGDTVSKIEFPNDFMMSGEIEDSRFPLADGAKYRFLSWNLGCGVGVAADCLEVLNEYRPDILALQESDKSIHVNVINQFLKQYSFMKHVSVMHPGTSTYNYTPIIYDTRRFNVVEYGVDWLDGRYTGTNTKSLTWVVFEEIDTGSRFAMVNFHGAVCSASYKGYENMTDAQRSEIAANWRIDNVRQILDVQKKIYEKYGELPFTVNGDCNFNENSVPYANLKAAGFADAEKTAEKIIKSGYKTSYSYANGIPGTGLSIDHFFGMNGIRFVSFDIIRTAKVGTASDHCAIYTDYCPCPAK
ncbi:MAG: hypothetical protein MJ137_01820 [Clostridia bacterium]|nr:hypothetical protein [Clostridia bacterium]